MDGWEALANIVKYVRRGSLLEALDQLHRVRGRIFQLWAAGGDVPYPAFGLTSLLDELDLPPGIGDTYAIAERVGVVAAARAAADLLHQAGERAGPGLNTPLREYVGSGWTRCR